MDGKGLRKNRLEISLTSGWYLSIRFEFTKLKARDMLVLAKIILDNLLEERVDLPINAIHMYSRLKADRHPVHPGDTFRQTAFQRRQRIDFGPPIGSVFVHSWILDIWKNGLSSWTYPRSGANCWQRSSCDYSGTIGPARIPFAGKP